MPATDPFSGAFRPLPTLRFDQVPREPLPFAAVPRPLHDITSVSSNNAVAGPGPSTIARPKAKVHKEKEGFPSKWAPSQYGSHHARTGSEGAAGLGLGEGKAGEGKAGEGSRSGSGAGRAPEPEVGGDEWMRARIDGLWDKNDGILDLNKQGLTFLSSEIANLRDYVSLVQVSASPRPSTLRAPPSPDPSLLNNNGLSPGSNPFAANGRSFSPFQRTVSAPVSSTFFQQAVGGGRTRAEGFKGLAQEVKEEREEEDDPRGGRRVVTASPALAGPSIIIPPPEAEASRQLAAPSPRQAELGKSRTFGRSRTGGAALLSALGVGDGAGPGKAQAQAQRREELTLFLANNLLTTLPSALFEVTHLTTLSLRSNKLTHLPPAIGELRRLTELNIANNLITFLPSTILDLNLTIFTAHPNKWLSPPMNTSADKDRDGATDLEALMAGMSIGGEAPPVRQLGPLISHTTSDAPPACVPRLTDIILRYLLSPRPPSDLPPLLEEFDWERTYAEDFRPLHKPHPLLDARSLGEILPQMHGNELERTLQSLRSSSIALQRRKGDRRASTAGQGVGAVYNDNPLTSSQSSSSRQRLPDGLSIPRPQSAQVRSDNATLNPYYSPCPSPRHHVYEDGAAGVGHRPKRQIYLRPAEERIEWRDVFGQTGLPIRWEGCSPGCLAFLEEGEDDDWSIDGSGDGI